MLLVPRLRALRVASPTPCRGQHLRPGGAGCAVFHDEKGPMAGGRRALLVAGGAALLWLAGCAQLSGGAPGPKSSGSWTGRMSLRIDSEPVQTFSALFELRGSAEAGDLTLTTPIGSTL